MDDYDWSAEGDFMEAAAEATSEAKKKIGSALRTWRNALLLAAIILLDILRRFVVLGFDPDRIAECAFAAVITSMATLFAFYVFFPNGKSARRMHKSYKEATTRLSTALAKMKTSHLLDAFRKHCRDLTKNEEKAAKDSIYEDLKDKYLTDAQIKEFSKLNRKALAKKVKAGEINEATKKLIVKYQRPIKCKPYSPAYFLSGLNKRRQDAMLHGKGGFEARTLAMRPVLSIAVAVVATAISHNAVQSSGTALEVLFSIALSVFQILFAAFSGYCSGQTAAEYEELAATAKAVFVEEFLEKAEKQPEPAANVHEIEKSEG